MRIRSIYLLAATLVLLVVGSVAPAVAADRALAQDQDTVGQEEEAEGQEQQGEGGQEADTETGAGEGEQEGAAEEEGPVWTYQMWWITTVLLVLMLLAIGGAYWNFVAKRQKQGI